jgi:hypothetical protein
LALAASWALPVLPVQTRWKRKVVRNFSAGSGVYGAEIFVDMQGAKRLCGGYGILKSD